MKIPLWHYVRPKRLGTTGVENTETYKTAKKMYERLTDKWSQLNRIHNVTKTVNNRQGSFAFWKGDGTVKQNVVVRLVSVEKIIQHVGLVWRQSVEGCSSGRRASWVGGQVLGRGCRSSRQSQWRWTNSTSHKSSNSWLPGWAVSRQSSLPSSLLWH